MSVERSDPANNNLLTTLGGKDEMKKTSINLQDLRRKIYLTAKAEKTRKFWGLYVHVCKTETLEEAYRMAKKNNGAPGIDGVTFEVIEGLGREQFLIQIQKELQNESYLPLRNRKREIPKANGKVRVLGIPTIRDRVVQGALKLILEPIFDADFQDGSYGYRPKRTQLAAVERVATAAIANKTRVIDIDLTAYFDNVRHEILLNKVAARIDDNKVLHLLKLILKAGAKKGVPQGGVISPLLSNIYLNEVDKMLERAKESTRHGKYTYLEYARFADDLVVLVDGFRKWTHLVRQVCQRLLEEFAKLGVEVNREKSKIIDLEKGDTFRFLSFDYRRVRTRSGKWGILKTPSLKARTNLLQKIKEVIRRHNSQPIDRVIYLINPILRGWVNYFRIGSASRCFSYIKDWVEKKIRRHMMRSRKLRGFGWDRWSREWIYTNLRLFNDYKVRYYAS